MEKKLSSERKEFLARDFVQGFPAYVGYTVKSVEYGRFETRLVIEPHHTQQDGFVHAGVMATMVDHSMGYAAFSAVEPDFRILTVEYKINFIRPAKGRDLICRSRVIKVGPKLIPTEGEVFSFDGTEETLVAKSMATMAAVPDRKLKP
jgi:uncharacterized protein (TIGR00369 family)